MNLSDFKTNREKLQELFTGLRTDIIPLWGKMNPQQMVEHLVDEVQWTNGKIQRICTNPEEEAEGGKQLMVYSDILMPRNFYAGDLPCTFSYPCLQSALQQLAVELDDFDQYFRIPGAKATHPLFGPLNYMEWLIWQNKHFSHHLRQFQMLPIPPWSEIMRPISFLHDEPISHI